MARKDRHSLFGGRMDAILLFIERGSQGHRHDEDEWEVIRTAGRELRPVFFLNPLGRGSAPGRNGSLEREEPAGNRLICEGFDPGSE